MAPTLGYWDIRGLAEPIRYLFHYTGQDFEDKRYYTYPSWLESKFQLGLDFPNLPYFIDGDVHLTQSTTILRYLAKKHGLNGKTAEEQLQVELVEQQIVDLRTRFMSMCYSPCYDQLKDIFARWYPTQVDMLSRYLGKRNYFVGDSVTYVDFIAYDILEYLQFYTADVYKDHENLNQYLERFRNLPQLSDCFESPSYKKWPIFGPVAKFGGR